MLEFFEFGAVVFTGIFAGAAFYVTVVEQAAREDADAAASLAVFKAIFHRAAKFQIPLLSLSVIASLGSLFLSGNWMWLVGALAMACIVPFTLIVLMPLNNRLLKTEPDDPDLSPMLKSWGPLQLVRTSVALACFGLVSYLAILL